MHFRCLNPFEFAENGGERKGTRAGRQQQWE